MRLNISNISTILIVLASERGRVMPLSAHETSEVCRLTKSHEREHEERWPRGVIESCAGQFHAERAGAHSGLGGGSRRSHVLHSSARDKRGKNAQADVEARNFSLLFPRAAIDSA